MHFSQFRLEHENITVSKEKLIEFIEENLHGFKSEPLLGMACARYGHFLQH